ncbi:hypothetical protein THAOC_31815, partial [Thalassiosira oceanica]
ACCCALPVAVGGRPGAARPHARRDEGPAVVSRIRRKVRRRSEPSHIIPAIRPPPFRPAGDGRARDAVHVGPGGRAGRRDGGDEPRGEEEAGQAREEAAAAAAAVTAIIRSGGRPRLRPGAARARHQTAKATKPKTARAARARRTSTSGSTGPPSGSCPPSSSRLSPPDVALMTTLMTAHARRSSVSGAVTCERLLKRLVDEADGGNDGVYVTTKMYTIAMDAWAKSQRRPLPGSSVGDEEGRRGGRRGRNGQPPYGFEGRQEAKNKARFNPRLSARPAAADDGNHSGSSQGDKPQGGRRRRKNKNSKRAPRPSPTARPRTERTGSTPTCTISYNAAINAWSKSYHPSAGEMAELLLCEMLDGWRFGRRTEEGDGEGSAKDSASNSTAAVVNDGVKPDVVTFTAVIDAWVKCTALAHDYHYSGPGPGEADDGERGQRESYSEWRRAQAERADGLTRRAAERAMEILDLMIALGHYDPERGKAGGAKKKGGDKATEELPFEPGMRPNCYTYSAVMNALAKSCSAARAYSYSTSSAPSSSRSSSSPPNKRQEQRTAPAGQGRVGEDGVWRGADVARGLADDANGVTEWNVRDLAADAGPAADPLEEDERLDDDGLGGGAPQSRLASGEEKGEEKSKEDKEPHWYDPRPDELSFPPNAVNYNSVLNAWSRASRGLPRGGGRREPRGACVLARRQRVAPRLSGERRRRGQRGRERQQGEEEEEGGGLHRPGEDREGPEHSRQDGGVGEADPVGRGRRVEAAAEGATGSAADVDPDDPADDLLLDDELAVETAAAATSTTRPSIANPDNQLGNSGAPQAGTRRAT